MRTGPVCFASVLREAPKTLLEFIGQRIATKRMDRRVTQGYLAGLVGVSRAQIANIEAGRTSTDLLRFLEICDALECTADELLEGYW